MPDLVFVVVTLAFFALCAVYVGALDRLVRSAEEGPPDELSSPGRPGSSTGPRAAGASGAGPRPGPRPEAMP